MQKDKDDIYNSFTWLPLYTFDDLLSRVNEYAIIENDEITTVGPARRRNGILGNLTTPREREGNKTTKSVRMDSRV